MKQRFVVVEDGPGVTYRNICERLNQDEPSSPTIQRALVYTPTNEPDANRIAHEMVDLLNRQDAGEPKNESGAEIKALLVSAQGHMHEAFRTLRDAHVVACQTRRGFAARAMERVMAHEQTVVCDLSQLVTIAKEEL